MTVLAAVLDSRAHTAAMGGDTQATYGYTKVPSGPKIVKRGNVLYGFSGCQAYFRFLNEIPDEPPPANWLNALADQWFAWAKERGHGKQNDEGTLLLDGRILVAAPSGLWTLDGDGAVTRHDVYAAIGSGAEVALGSLYSTDFDRPYATCSLHPTVRVRLAVEAAIEHAVGCGGEPRVLTVEAEDRP